MRQNNQKNNLSESPVDAPDQIGDSTDWNYRLSEWLGALICYVLLRPKRPFDYYYHKKYETRNFWLGYGLIIIGLIFLMGTLFFLLP